ncbi:MAG: CARDB domain-containing protein [Planctomycetota bacterium]
MRLVSRAAWLLAMVVGLVALGGGACTKKNRPDLTLSNLPSAFTATVAGGTVSINVTANNVGQKISNGYVLSAYLSKTTVLDSTAIKLGNSPLQPALLPGASVAVPAWTVTVPGGSSPTLPGVYQLIILIDSTGLTAESNESNNTAAAELTVLETTGLPDLAVQTLTLSASAVTRGQSVSVDWNFVNLGGQSGTSDNGFYLSTDTVFDSSDVYLGVSVAPNFTAGGVYTGTSSVAIPTTTAAGSYYILLVLDRTSAVTESDEFNNTIAQPITVTSPIGVDYVVANDGNALTEGQGDSFQLTAIAANAGSVNALNPVRVGAYISSTQLTTMTNSGTTLIGSAGVGPLNATSGSSVTINITIPPTLATGTYYLGFVIDDLDQEPDEVNKLNNGSSVVTVTVVNDDTFEPDDSIAAAKPIVTNTVYSNLYVFPGNDDWYSVTLGGSSNTLTATITDGAPSDVEIAIYDGSGTLIGAGAVTANGWSGTLTGLAAGNYYLKVFSNANDNAYSLAAYTTSPARAATPPSDSAPPPADPAPATSSGTGGSSGASAAGAADQF